MLKLLIAVLLTLSSANAISSNAKVYQWIDDRGTTHFSDKPAPGSYEIQVDVVPPATYGPLVTPRHSNPSVLTAEPKAIYKVTITSPLDESTLRDHGGDISISVATSPNPPSHSGYRLIFDNIPQGLLQEAPIFSLTNVERGVHTMQVQLVDQTGKEIATSKLMTVYMHRTTR